MTDPSVSDDARRELIREEFFANLVNRRGRDDVPEGYGGLIAGIFMAFFRMSDNDLRPI
jgi:hypothetical protein